jgi:hypothetical protein
MHFGGSIPAYEAIAARKDLLEIDGIKGRWEGTVFFRDPDRRKELGMEHSVYTTWEYLELALEMLDKPLEQENAPSAFTFDDVTSAAEGETAEKVTLTFSANHKPYFVYDAETGTYLRHQYGEAHMDAWQERQIAVTNLLVLRMELSDVPNSDLKLVEVETTGSGAGIYCHGGKYIPITWHKDAYNTPISFFTEDGQPLVCAPGQSFVSCITTTADLIIE